VDSDDDLEFGDTAYTTAEIGLHTDGTYFSQPPGIQVHRILLDCWELVPRWGGLVTRLKLSMGPIRGPYRLYLCRS